MVPIVPESEADDEFVRTISDEDVGFAYPEEEDYAEADPISTSTPQDQKRKRGSFQATTQASRKKRRKEEKAPNDRGSRVDKIGGNGDTSSTLGQNEAWFAQEEDDGAMNSDFEFQVTTVGTGIVEEFDSWDQEGAELPTIHKSGDKKGVDIDKLIARRREGKAGKMKSDGNGAQIHDQDVPVDEEEDEEEEQAVESDEGGDTNTRKENLDGSGDEEEDETLAEDAFGMGAEADEHTGDTGGEISGHTATESDSEEEVPVADAMPDPNDLETDSGEEEAEEIAKRKSFFAPEEPITTPNAKEAASSKAFQSMNLSRPILRGLASVGFINPTPIQTKTIPIALLGKDIVGGAVTGSGKTGAFIIPILERLLHRPKKIATTRVAILMPTRELAVQCFTVAKKLASFTDITFALLTGGFSLREQENGLRNRPDIIIATPGRFIDHMRNSPSFTVDTLEILVLDEADRMLEDGFADELNEILTTIPRSRQTMLFSATMTDKVDKLVRVGLNRPVRLMVDARKQTVVTLTQEFVRVRPGKEDKRLGYLTHLCSDVFTERIIVFFRQRKEAHRVRIIFGLLGIKAAELHGSMSQEQRISSLTSFRDGHSTHLLATDLASRGLDIANVSVVLNYEAPQSHEIYLHRVGRTARAGRGGRACTIAAESDRRVVKQAVKAAKAQGAKIVSRVIDPVVADKWAASVKALDEEVDAILKDEKEEKLLNQTDMVLQKGENIMSHEDEIHARPRRTWFESERDKLQAKKAGKEELNGRVGLKKSKPGGKLSNKNKKSLDDKRERVESRAWKKGKGVAKTKNNGNGRDRKVKGGGKSKTHGATQGKARRPAR